MTETWKYVLLWGSDTPSVYDGHPNDSGIIDFGSMFASDVADMILKSYLQRDDYVGIGVRNAKGDWTFFSFKVKREVKVFLERKVWKVGQKFEDAETMK